MFFAIVLMLILSFIMSLIEALVVFWLGPHTGISYFDTATYWNVFFLVLIANMVTGGSNAVNNGS